jgi:P-type Ca2+ transporter type 2C
MSVSLAVAVRRMARRHALIKRLTAVEALGSTTVICTDPDGEVEDAGCADNVLRAGGLCCDARLVPPDPARPQGWRVLGDTTEGAILVAAAKGGVDLAAEQDCSPSPGPSAR